MHLNVYADSMDCQKFRNVGISYHTVSIDQIYVKFLYFERSEDYSNLMVFFLEQLFNRMT